MVAAASHTAGCPRMERWLRSAPDDRDVAWNLRKAQLTRADPEWVRRWPPVAAR